MKKIFLRTTASDKFYKSYKNVDISFWAKDFSKKKLIKSENLTSILNNKNKIKIYNISHKISKKFTRIIYKVLKKNLSEKISYNEWEIIFYPFVVIFINIIISRKLIIDNFLSKKRYKKISLNQAIIKNKEFEFNSTEDFIKVYDSDKFNNYLIIRIIKNIKKISLNLKKIQFSDPFQIKKNFIAKHLLKIKRGLNFFLAKISYKVNSIVFDTIYISKKDFFILCLKLKIFPYKISELFDYRFNKLYNENLRSQLLSEALKNKLSNKEKLFIKILIPIIPKNFIENLEQLILFYKKFRPKKKVITSISFYYNEIFRIFLILCKRHKTEIIRLDHGGGLALKKVPNTYVQKKIFNKFAIWGKHSSNGFQIPRDKRIYINPTLPTVNLLINENNQEYLSLIFNETFKFSFNHDGMPQFTDQDKLLKELIYFSKNLPSFIKKKIIFKSKANFGLYSSLRFKKEVFKSNKFQDNNLNIEGPFSEIIKKSKIMIFNFPSTAYSESMSLNIPSILYTNPKNILLDTKSENLIFSMKKNQMLFSNPYELLEHIKKVWSYSNNWWGVERIQKIRSFYLKNYFNTLDDLSKNLFCELKKN